MKASLNKKMTIPKRLEFFFADRNLPDPATLTLKQIDQYEKAALDVMNGIGNRHEVCASVVVLAQALKNEKAKNKRLESLHIKPK